jgi:Flp pilus assembly protein TadD
MLTGLGAALFADGAFEEATKQLCKAADLKPQDASPYVFLGKIEEATVDELSCSEEKLARFAKEQPENALANYYLGIALRKRTKNSEDETGEKRAEEFFEKAVRLDPKLSEGYLQLGIIRAKRGETGKAAEDYQKAIEINPRSGPAHFRLAMVYKSLRKEAQAQAELQKFQQIEKEEAEVREQERRKLRQFQVILENKTENGAPR